MKLENLLNRLDSYKAGTFVKVIWSSDVSSAKAKKSGVEVTKNCEGLVRVGINYSNLKAVQEQLALRDENEPKKESWYTHSEVNRCLVESKKDTEKKYLQVFTIPGKKIKSYMTVGHSKFKVSADKLYELGLITKSALPNNDEMHVFTLAIDKIKSFGGTI